MTEPRPSILAAGPLTFEEAEALMSSLPPPAPGGAPAPEEPTAEPAEDVERCSCEEALALRADLARVRGLRDAVQAIALDYACEIITLRAKCDALENRDNRRSAAEQRVLDEMAAEDADEDDLERPARAQPREQPALSRVVDSLPPVNNPAALAKALLAQRLKKRSRFSDQDKAKIFGQFLRGESVENIGAGFGVSGMTIRKLIDDTIREGGLEPPKRGRRKREGQ